jgi:hypothetical protein
LDLIGGVRNAFCNFTLITPSIDLNNGMTILSKTYLYATWGMFSTWAIQAQAAGVRRKMIYLAIGAWC